MGGTLLGGTLKSKDARHSLALRQPSPGTGTGRACCLTLDEVPAEIETLPANEHTLAATLPMDHPLLGGRKAHKIPFPLRPLAGGPFVLLSVPKKPVLRQWLPVQRAASGFASRVLQYAESVIPFRVNCGLLVGALANVPNTRRFRVI